MLFPISLKLKCLKSKLQLSALMEFARGHVLSICVKQHSIIDLLTYEIIFMIFFLKYMKASYNSIILYDLFNKNLFQKSKERVKEVGGKRSKKASRVCFVMVKVYSPKDKLM